MARPQSHLKEYKKVELSALQCLSVCLCGDFKSKPQSSCNFQPWLKVSACILPKSKCLSFQIIYLDQVQADSSKPSSSSKRILLTLHQLTIHTQLPETSPVSPLSLAPHHSPSSKLIFISICCFQSRLQFHYSLLKK
ncbi:hypothetical protein CHARACLAT_011567 [Characodon lateralis]|uniref:Uncharacterized protein n=1 Tax=Characodon lateralis TaxID=208331 RepID=A0ABU7DZQ0_9TELE|nr:hypothetical protein [Characodon lateralis]